MAKLYLFREEMGAYRPPAVCMRCGAAAERVTFKTYLWTQGATIEGLGFISTLINLVTLLTGTKRFRLPIPLCRKHISQRRWKTGVVLGGPIAVVLLTLLGVFALRHADHQNELSSLGVWSLGCAGALAVGMLFVAAMMHTADIQLVKITNEYIALFKVSPHFVDGVDLQRTEYPRGLRRRIAETLWSECDAFEDRGSWTKAGRESAEKAATPATFRITDSGRNAMHLANLETQRLNQEYIGTDHILLGLINQGQCLAARVLVSLNVDLEKLRREVAQAFPHGPDMVATGNPPAPRGKHVIEFATEEARNLNHDYVGTEHLLLGILRESGGTAGRILRSAGLRLEVVRQQVIKLLEGCKGAVDRHD
jgi:hypothetical protein